MNRNPHLASDGVFALMRVMNGYALSPEAPTRSDFEVFARRLCELGGMALTLEHEVGRHRWNELARAEAAERERLEAREQSLLIEASQPGSNVVLLMPRRPRLEGGE